MHETHHHSRHGGRWLSRLGLTAAVLLVGTGLVLSLQAQGKPTLEEELLQILKDKGVLSDAEYRSLKARIDTKKSKEKAKKDSKVKVSYKAGKGVVFQTGDKRFKTQLGGRMQVRHTFTDYDNDNRPKEKFDTSTFEIKRMRIWLSGNAFHTWLKYKFQADFPSKGGGVKLKDAWAEVAKLDLAKFRFGQFKAPYSRQELTSSGRQQFVDRAITKTFAVGREPGVMLHGNAAEKMFHYWLGVSNGMGENGKNDDNQLRYTARLQVNNRGGGKFRETAVHHPDNLEWAFAVNGTHNTMRADLDADGKADDDVEVHGYGADVAFWYKRFSFAGEYHDFTTEFIKGADPLDVDPGDVDSDGWLAQVGFFLIPQRFEIALRHATVDPDTNVMDNSESESRIAFNYFSRKHNLKFQVDLGQLDESVPGGDTIEDKEARAQFQIIF